MRLLLLPVLLFIMQPFVVSAKVAMPIDDSKTKEALLKGFITPPDSVKPGVYWYFMDGNISKKGMTEDLESMKKAGIGSLIFLEVNVGIPRGPVTFLSDEWQELFKHAVKEAQRLGIAITLGSGPGWAGSGGPWVEPAQSMQHLVASDTIIKGPTLFKGQLQKPKPRKPYFGYGVFTDDLRTKWENYYEDVTVLAFPTPASNAKIPDIDEKALYYRAPYSSTKNVKPYLSAKTNYPVDSEGSIIPKEGVVDLSKNLLPDGTLNWNVPAGKWTILRMGKRNNGAVTRPAPQPGLGLECDKMDTAAFNLHYNAFIGKLLQKVGKQDPAATGGWKMIHIDSWEMGSQNWSSKFQEEFLKRRNYDLSPYLPTYTGRIVGSREISERFLWDIRKTAQELVIENHAQHFKDLGRRSGLRLSIEPYDMNPTADLELGAVADIPMCEFWSKGYGFNTSFSCIEATSIAHVTGKPVVHAESFTSGNSEGWKLYPGAIKNQGDWAFATGINKFYYHTFAHQPLNDQLRPGMTMGPYGVHWDRGQTWWPMASAYHTYIARCSFLLQQGKTTADILYLTPEGAPHVFRPPLSAMTGNDTIPDRRGYNFDGCAPGLLISLAKVVNKKIVFPDGGSYQLLILPLVETMTPELLSKIESLANEGATIVGIPPKKSPSLVNFPACDQLIQTKVAKMWKSASLPSTVKTIPLGKGKIILGGNLTPLDSTKLYPDYEATVMLLKQMNVQEDFSSDGPVRYTHRKTSQLDIYYVSNRTEVKIAANCHFRATSPLPELWDPNTGTNSYLNQFSVENGISTIRLRFEPNESYFVVFDKSTNKKSIISKPNFADKKRVLELTGSWEVSFDTLRGGPEKIAFNQLTDWTNRPEDGIRYFSGIAKYKKSFTFTPESKNSLKSFFLELGKVNCMAHITLNGNDLGSLWTAPWCVDITDAVRIGENQVEIEVANLWPNRLIGDEKLPYDGIENRKWPDWLLENKARKSGRITFASYNFYKKDAPLYPSGLIGPVSISGIK